MVTWPTCFCPAFLNTAVSMSAHPSEPGGWSRHLHTAPRNGCDRQRPKAHIETTTLADGQPTDRSDHRGRDLQVPGQLLGGNASRVVVLRPHLSDADRVQALGMLFEYLGDDYDFDFDFSDDSAQCCTELIYRILRGLRGRHSPSSCNASARLLPPTTSSFLPTSTDPGLSFHPAGRESPKNGRRNWTCPDRCRGRRAFTH